MNEPRFSLGELFKQRQLGVSGMGRILIANIDNESMLADRSVLTYEFRCHSAIAASKHAWFAEAGDIVVLPEPLPREMRQYMALVKGIPLNSITYIAPSCQAADVYPLGADALLDAKLLDRIERATNGKQDWELCPYHYDRASTRLRKALGLTVDRSIGAFLEEGGADLFNDKKIFRSLATGCGLKVARGDVIRRSSELLPSLTDLIGDTGAVIIKQNRHSGALGNIIVAATKSIDGQGASEIIFVNDRLPLSKAANFIWDKLCAGGAGALVVEAYHPVTKVCYGEYLVKSKSDAPIFLNLGEQRMEPLFAGFEIPGRIPAYQQARFVSGAIDLARLAQGLGFTGLIDVDGIITCDGEVIYCEVNGRYGGCSHVHHLAERLLGSGYGDTHTILTRNGVRAPFFGDVLRLIEDHNLSLTAESGEGILITAEDTGRTGTLDYVIAADDRDRAYEIELWFLAQLREMLDEHQPQKRISAGYH